MKPGVRVQQNDERRVRPLPPEHGVVAQGAPRMGWIAGAAAVVIVFTAIYLTTTSPGIDSGQELTSPDPAENTEPRPEIPAELAPTDATVTAEAPAVSVTPSVPAGSDEPEWTPESPLTVSTPFGPFTWIKRVLPGTVGVDAITNPVVVGDRFALLTTTQRAVELWTSRDGREWTGRPLSRDAFGPEDLLVSLTATETGMIATGSSRGAPAAWSTTDGRSWSRIDLGLGNLPSSEWMSWSWGGVKVADAPGIGTVLWGSVWGGWVDWHDVLDAPADSTFEWDGTISVLRLLPDRSDTPIAAFSLHVLAEDSTMSVEVVNVSTGEAVFSGSQQIRFTDGSAFADEWLRTGGMGPTFVPVVWTSSDGTDFRRASSPPGPIGGPGTTAVAATSRGFLGISSTYQGSASPDLRVWFSEDGRAWEALGALVEFEEQATIESIAAFDDVYVAAGSARTTVQLSENFRVTGPSQGFWVSDDGFDWRRSERALSLKSPGISFGQTLAGGPLGWVISGELCDAICRPEISFSVDAQTWHSILSAPTEYGLSPQQSGVAIGDGAIVAANLLWSESSSLPEAELWIGIPEELPQLAPSPKTEN